MVINARLESIRKEKFNGPVQCNEKVQQPQRNALSFNDLSIMH